MAAEADGGSGAEQAPPVDGLGFGTAAGADLGHRDQQLGLAFQRLPVVFGAAVDPFASYSTRGSLEFATGLAGHVLELMPALANLRMLRQWAGLCDMTPDFGPIIGPTEVDGFYVDVGWGTYGFKAGPVAGESVAAMIANQSPPPLIRPFGLDRFARGTLTAEKGAAAVGH